MPDLLLHIGHVKTGSTWLQEAFRLGAGRLAEAQIAYPLPRQPDYDRTTPSGNATLLLDSTSRIAPRLRGVVARPLGTTLFSSEVMFNRLTGQRSLGTLVSAARDLGFDRVRLLLFTRAPLPLAVSIWLQRVKGWEGETRDLDDWATRFDLPERVLALAEAAAAEGAELTLLNYDAHRGDLLAPVEGWLGIAPGTLERPASERLNRSLTRAEAALQLALNRALGPSQEVFAQRLANRLPDLPSDPPRLSAPAAEALLARLTPALDRLDPLLSSEPLSRAIPSPIEGPVAFTEAQLAVIAEGIASYLAPPPAERLRRTLRAFRRRRRGR